LPGRRVSFRAFAEASRRRFMRAVDPKRRFNCADQHDPSWQERAEAAVQLFAGSSSERAATHRLAVADLGCGNERLQPVLQRSLGQELDYQGYDLHPQSARVIRLDLRAGLPARTFDVVFGLGVLEYLDDIPTFAVRLREISGAAVVSYVTTDLADSLAPAERRKRSWLTDYTRRELDTIFVDAGFDTVDFTWTNAGHTGLWLLTSGQPSSAARRSPSSSGDQSPTSSRGSSNGRDSA
jgi:hypothetical protein